MATGSAEQLKVVKEYITKYNLEDHLSQGINRLIQADEQAPFTKLAEYFKDLAISEGEIDEDEDDDDVIPEGEEPMRAPVGRRAQVAAAKFEVPENWTAPYFEKSEEDMAFLKEVMLTNKLMKNLSPSDRESIMNALEKKSFATGSDIIKQGDAGDLFYILHDGMCDISINGKGSVMKATKGIAFGELALLHGAPRAATVTAEEAVTAWALDEVSFKMILMGKSQKDNEDVFNILRSVPLLKDVSDHDLKEMASVVKEVEFPPGTPVVVEGDEGTMFYIVKEGELKATKGSQEVSKRLKQGDYFGELALLGNGDKRAATVSVVEQARIYEISKQMFQRLVGNLFSNMSEAERNAGRT